MNLYCLEALYHCWRMEENPGLIGTVDGCANTANSVPCARGGLCPPPCVMHPEGVRAICGKPKGVVGVIRTCWGKVCIYDYDATRGLVDTK